MVYRRSFRTNVSSRFQRRLMDNETNCKTIICNTGPYFYGDLVQNEDLDKIATQREKKYQQIVANSVDRDQYLREGWQFIREHKKRLLFRKQKPYDELLEDSVWLLFRNMGFQQMNKDRNFKIQVGPIQKQIDVFARDDKNVFIIECKAQSEETSRALLKDIHEILSLRKDIIKSVHAYYKQKVRVSFLIITENIVWSSADERLATANRRNGLFYWKEKELEAFVNLTKQLGKTTKFQLYSILFSGRKIYEIQAVSIPAICGGKGKKRYYLFTIQPEKLLQIAYVHRREESDPEEVAGTYQRMVKKTRADKICGFVNKGGFFPNNVIINFTKKPIFERKAEVGDIVYGILRFPPYYGSAWIIDGQHRLYGYSNSPKRATDTLPVVAFESLPVKDQANIFVEINREQKSVSSSMLWDLYPDIYYGSEEKEYQILRTISLIAKKLNSDNDSPLCNYVRIPSMMIKDKKTTNLTITTLCDGIKENRLIDEGEGLLYEKNYECTVDSASEVIKVYFDVISKSFPEDWNQGDNGLLRTNVGMRILFIILRQILRHLNYKGQVSIYRKKDLTAFKNETSILLNPALRRIKGMSEIERNKIRGETGKGPIMNNAQRMAWWIKEEIGEAFSFEILRKWAPPRPKEESDDNIRNLLENTEKDLRDFLIKKLQEIYGAPWWRQGVPEDIKKDIKDRIQKQIDKEPWRKDELSSLSPERRLTGFSDTPHLRETIEYTTNWEHLKCLFIPDKEITLARFKDFEFVRNKYQHFAEHECDEISKNLGYWSMRWIRRCLGFNTLKGEAQ